jgi:hypothetical protein
MDGRVPEEREQAHFKPKKENSLHNRSWEWYWIIVDSISEVRGPDWAPRDKRIAELCRHADEGGSWNLELSLLQVDEEFHDPADKLLECHRLLRLWEERKNQEQEPLNRLVTDGRLSSEESYEAIAPWLEQVAIIECVLRRIRPAQTDRWAEALLEDGMGYLRRTGDLQRPYRWLLTLPNLLALWRGFLESEGWKLSSFCSLFVDKEGRSMDAKKVAANEPMELSKEAIDALKRAGLTHTSL